MFLPPEKSGWPRRLLQASPCGCPTGPCGCCDAYEAIVLWPVAGKRVLCSNFTRRARARGQHGGELEQSASPPRLLTGAARVEMMQVSMFILVVLSSAHSQTPVGVLVSPMGMGQVWQSQAQLFLAGCGVPQHHSTVGYPGILPLQVLALSTSLHRLLLLSCLQTPPPPTLLSPLCSLERNQGDGLIKSHSQPAKPPPCSPGKCSLWTCGHCRDMAVGQGGTMQDQCWGESCAQPGVSGQGGELLEGPVLCLHHCKQPCVGPVGMYLPKVCVGTWGWDV